MKGNIVGPWNTVDHYHPKSGQAVAYLECADLRTPDGYLHRMGAWRVGATKLGGGSHTRSRQWRGETAEYQAERAFWDLRFKLDKEAEQR